MRRAMRTTWCAAGFLLALAVAGCGRELVGGGQRDVDAVATGGGAESGGSATPASSYGAERATAFQAEGVSGTVTFDARVSLVRAGRRSAVGAGSATVRAGGGDTARVAAGRVLEGGYDAARVVFTRVTANVSGGLVVGGVALTGHVDVAIAPGDSVVVEMPVQVSGSRSPVRLLIELDAATWLRSADPLTRTVPAAAFRGAVRLRAE